MSKAMGVSLVVAVAGALALSWTEINRIDPVVLTVQIGTQAFLIWGLGALAIFFSARQHLLRNWLLVMLILLGLIFYGRMA